MCQLSDRPTKPGLQGELALGPVGRPIYHSHNFGFFNCFSFGQSVPRGEEGGQKKPDSSTTKITPKGGNSDGEDKEGDTVGDCKKIAWFV